MEIPKSGSECQDDFSRAHSDTSTPLLRALGVLAAFTTHDSWLGASEIRSRTGLPATTSSRLLHTLTAGGYLQYCRTRRAYRLGAPVLSLGYAANSYTDVQRRMRADVARFAQTHKLTILLAMRDRLDLVVLDSYLRNENSAQRALYIGTRIEIARSSFGYTLLAALPSHERVYLMDNMARRSHESWTHFEAQLESSMSQIASSGFCYTRSVDDSNMTLLSVPLRLPGRGVFVLACLGAPRDMSKSRVMREIGPELVSLSRRLKKSLAE